MKSTDTTTLVLFDIDGTLLRTFEAGIRSMNLAFGDLHGRADALATVAIAGRPDLGIITDGFRAIGVEPRTERIHALRDVYFLRLRTELERTSGDAFGILPGVTSMLDALATVPDVTVGLLTGNFAGSAAIKLRYFGLWHRFRLGAFGDEHVYRRDLVPVATARAREIGIDVHPSRIVIIGDTPLDVDCAHANGARAVAVATGNYSREELTATGAELVVATLEECGASTAWLDAVLASEGRATIPPQ